MLLKYLDWFQNAIYFVGTNYRKFSTNYLFDFLKEIPLEI